ncbi:MAG: hypothetical protein ACPH54_07710 [Candidatus Poseidoniaceae archaeon]
MVTEETKKDGPLAYPLRQDRVATWVTFGIKTVVTPEEQGKQVDDTSSENKDSKTVTEVSKKMKLYLPAGFGVADSLQYTNVDIGSTGAAALAGMGAAASGEGSALMSVVSSFAGGIKDGLASIGDLFQTGQMDALAKLSVARGINNTKDLMTDEVKLGSQLALQVALNPNSRAMFKGVNLRSFSFAFTFVPTSPEEAEMVEQIIYRFRWHAYPKPINLGTTGITAGFEYPHLFTIELTHQESNQTVGTKIKDCYLESVTTAYNPSSMAYHSDGRPVEYNMTLNFRETIALTQEDIEKGY